MPRMPAPLVRAIKRACAFAFGLYLLAFLGMWGYLGPSNGWKRALALTDHFLASGPVLRLVDPFDGDDAMIERFHRQRPVLEQLLVVHEEKCFKETALPMATSHEYPEVTSLRQQISLLGVGRLSSIWAGPDPYSADGQTLVLGMSGSLGEIVAKAGMLNRAKPAPDLARAQALMAQTERKMCRYMAATFVAADAAGGTLSKGWIHFPAVPRVAQGWLYEPNFVEWDKPIAQVMVWPHLDGMAAYSLPLDACVYRRIEATWFLFVCPAGLAGDRAAA